MEIVKTFGTAYTFDNQEQKGKLLDILGAYGKPSEENVIMAKYVIKQDEHNYLVVLENGVKVTYCSYNGTARAFYKHHVQEYIPVMKSIKKSITKRPKNYMIVGVIKND